MKKQKLRKLGNKKSLKNFEKYKFWAIRSTSTIWNIRIVRNLLFLNAQQNAAQKTNQKRKSIIMIN